MTTMNISVIVVSHHRPQWLARCLKALRQLDYPSYEIVIVADSASLGKIETQGLKTCAFDPANISAARNLGLRHAAGEICAYIDDDAAAEPLWLQHLAEGFATTGADALVGYVRGRNGISFQSRIASVDIEGETHAEPHGGETALIPDLPPGRALKLVGTNMAYRRKALEKLNGFDEAYHYFLEDTDLSRRLVEAGLTAGAAPLAQVHHGFAPSLRRTSGRAPLDLFDIGRSSALFFRRHGTPDKVNLFKRIEARERARLLRHMVIGNCEPRDIRARLARLTEGWQDGLTAELPALPKDLTPLKEFSPVAPMPSGHTLLTSRLRGRSASLKKAAVLSSKGHRVSLMSFSRTLVRHHLRYTDDGFWLQTGGQFGRSTRETKRYMWCRFAKRCELEIARVAKVRGI